MGFEEKSLGVRLIILKAIFGNSEGGSQISVGMEGQGKGK